MDPLGQDRSISAVNKLNLPGNQEQSNESVIYKAKFRCLNIKIN